jgi:heme exporter protein B
MKEIGHIFWKNVCREYVLNVRQLRSLIHTCLFFFMILVFMPLTMPPDKILLRTIAPGVLWIALLLSILSSADRLFQQDYEDGIVEQWLLSGYPVSVFIAAKIFVQGSLTLLPMLLLSPCFALLFNLTPYETSVCAFSLICGAPALFSLCTLAAVFGTGLKQKSVLMGMLLFPLTLPILIFGAAALNAAMQELPVTGYLALLLGFSLLAFALLPLASAAVMRVTLAE